MPFANNANNNNNTTTNNTSLAPNRRESQLSVPESMRARKGSAEEVVEGQLNGGGNAGFGGVIERHGSGTCTCVMEKRAGSYPELSLFGVGGQF